jgi:hypothetical protein
MHVCVGLGWDAIELMSGLAGCSLRHAHLASLAPALEALPLGVLLQLGCAAVPPQL